jgi:hypothetical protein
VNDGSLSTSLLSRIFGRAVSQDYMIRLFRQFPSGKKVVLAVGDVGRMVRRLSMRRFPRLNIGVSVLQLAARTTFIRPTIT